MMKKILPLHLLRIASLLILSSCGFLNHAQADGLQELLAILGPVKGISAGFTQDTYNAKGEVQQHNEGLLKAHEPNRFYWKTAEPYPQEVITDGKSLWVFDPDLNQVTIKPFEENYSKTPAMLFAGNAAVISEQFTVEKIAVEKIAIEEKNKNVQGFRLLPKNNQGDLFESLEMTFEKNVPVSMTIRDAMQQKTIIFFSNVIINPDLPESQFQFVAPAGVEVLKAR